MAIKYKLLKQVKKDSEAVDIKDRVIQKTGHSVFFTLGQMEDNEKQLYKSRDKVTEILEPVQKYVEENPCEYTEEQQNAIMLYREAELRLEKEEQFLKDDENETDPSRLLTDKEKKELASNIEYSKAVMANITHFHSFVLDVTGEDADKIVEFRKGYLQYKEAKAKLDEINDILRNSEIEKKEIYKQLNIN